METNKNPAAANNAAHADTTARADTAPRPAPAPQISVCMATYNGARFVGAQIESILAQLGEFDELIVSDDGSTDGTLALLGECAARDRRVKILRNARTHGFAGNFENALLAVHPRSKFVFLSDQDDIWLPRKVERCVRELRAAPLVLLHHDSTLVRWDLTPFGESLMNSFGAGKTGWLANLLKWRWFGSHMAFSRALLDIALPFDRHITSGDFGGRVKVFGHDNTLFVCAKLAGFRIVRVREPLILYRRLASSLTTMIYRLWRQVQRKMRELKMRELKLT